MVQRLLSAKDERQSRAALLASWAVIFFQFTLFLLIGVALAAAVTVWLARKFVRRLGGYTGDLLGATQQATELAFYLGLACQYP